ncbi:MAG: hypothetical protein H0X39_09165 [Actinobacteria bacterium]|nr:hypothetical protein [Actinomycetota bacterium]
MADSDARSLWKLRKISIARKDPALAQGQRVFADGLTMNVLMVMAVMLAVAVVVAVLVDRFTRRADEDALERDEREISGGPSEWRMRR